MDSLIGIVSVVLGIGFLIFIHELGHFLAAKWYDVKVEKFSIGFGPSIWEFRKGETVYALAWIPLGGFVAMQNEDGVPGDAAASDDPRSFPNKSVGARIAIMSAGVVMNVIFGLLCFIGLYGSGMMTQSPTILGLVAPGSPSYEAGLREGDRVVAVGGIDSDLDFDRMRMRIMLSGPGETVELKVERPGHEGLLTIPIQPRSRDGDIAPTIGVLPTHSLTLLDVKESDRVRPYEAPPGIEESAKAAAEKLDLKPGDRVVALIPQGGEEQAVKSYEEFHSLMARYAAVPVELVLERKVGDGASAASERHKAIVPPNRIVDLGLIMTPGPVASLRHDGVAAKAGFKVGDEILAIDGQSDFDPVRLPALIAEKAGQAIPILVKREGESGAITLTATPEREAAWLPLPIRSDQPMDLPGLGMAISVRPVVKGVRPGSPAEKAGIKPGQALASLTISDPTLDPKKPREITLKFEGDDAKRDWMPVFSTLQAVPVGPVSVTLVGQKEPIRLETAAVDGWWNPDRGLNFEVLTEPMPALSVGAAIRRGYEETVFNIQSIYYTILRMFQGRVSTKGIGGPITIFAIGKSTASEGWMEFIKFLAVISVNLAVVNFLPIYPLDGGQLLLLLCEGVRGRPLPASLMAATQRVGLLLVLILMLFAIGQDIIRTITGS